MRPGAALGICGIGLLHRLFWRMAGANPQKPLHMLLYVLVSILGMLDVPEAVTLCGRLPAPVIQVIFLRDGNGSRR